MLISRWLFIGLCLICVGCAKSTICEIDTKERYFRIRQGARGVESVGPVRIPERPDQGLTEAKGDVEFVFRQLIGTRLVVETKESAFIEVVYIDGDKDAAKIAANGLKLVCENAKRATLVLALSVTKEGHRLQESPPPKEPFRYDGIYSSGDAWDLGAVTADDLAYFMECRLGRIVVNKTGLRGHWKITVPGIATRTLPEEGESIPIGDTGLRLKWQTEEVEVTVIRDP